MNGFEKFKKIVEAIGIEETLENLLRALSEQEKQENSDYIARMFDIKFGEEGETEND